MARIRFTALSTAVARAYQAGGPDAYGRTPELRVSDGDGVPCRHCLTDVEAGVEYLVLAHRPFAALQPYAETGPIFLHAGPCERHPESETAPELFRRRAQVLIRGYDRGERIVDGTGAILPPDRMTAAAAQLLDREDVAFVDVRSASNNCFQCRIERAATQP